VAQLEVRSSLRDVKYYALVLPTPAPAPATGLCCAVKARNTDWMCCSMLSMREARSAKEDTMADRADTDRRSTMA
jgi:hypothetical protein